MKRLGELFAVWATNSVGSLTCFFIFTIVSLLPLLPAIANSKLLLFHMSLHDFFLYISAGILQLILLPLILVGQALQQKHEDERSLLDRKVIENKLGRILNLLERGIDDGK